MKILSLAPLAAALTLIAGASYGVVSHAGAALISVAHAAPSGPAVLAQGVPPDAPAAPWLIYVGIALAAAGGALKIIDVLLAGLKWLAPQTKTTVDDDVRDGLQVAHDELGKAIDLLGGLAPAPSAGKTPQGGFARTGMIFALAVVGIFGACTAFKAEVKSIEAGVVECAKADQGQAQALGVALVSQAALSLITTGSPGWGALRAAAEAGVKSQGLDVAACAFGDLVARLDALLGQHAGILDPLADGRAALAEFQSAHGITAINAAP